MRSPSPPPKPVRAARGAADAGAGRPLRVRELSADAARDPLALHRAIRGPFAALLESSLREEGGSGARFSYSLPRPFARITWSPREGVRVATESGETVVPGARDPFALAEILLRERRAERREEVGPFSGGAVAVIGYGAAPLFEEKLRRGAASARPLESDAAVRLFFFDRGVAFDHASGRAFAFAAEGGAEPPRAFFDRIDAAAAGRDALPPLFPAPPREAGRPRLTSDFTRGEYLSAVERVREYIADGDAYQVNLAQRFTLAWPAGGEPEAAAVHARLREENPAPFGALIEIEPSRHVISASPELFLERRGLAVRTRPIKGTRPRVRDAARDAAARRDLLASEKDRAELAMIVDLERNDLGKVCETGSVRVAEAGLLETHPWVFHRVATVEGALRRGTSLGSLLGATFPTGSITGAPKIRAMEIIAEIERSPRGVYTGAFGWIGWDGDLDLAVAIRTIEHGRGEARFHVGGGIVADSSPESEYEETLHKARGLRRGLDAEGAEPSVA